MNENYDHLTEAKALLDLAARENEQTSANVAIVAQTHATIAIAEQSKRIADALEKLTGAMSARGNMFDVRIFE